MNRHFRVAVVAAAAWAASGPAEAQSTRVYTPRATEAFKTDDPNSARIGVFLGENGLRDTLGVLVNSVVDGGPAAKAGIKEGDRIQAIGSVNLKMTRDDAGDDALTGMMSRRLVRELDKLKAGDEAELRVFSGGTTKTVRVKTVSSHELASAPNTTKDFKAEPMLREFRSDRAALGISTGGRSTKRDTLGLFVMSVTPDGPAEKAGIVEGDRIAKINGVDLRVPSEDAGDRELASARSRRFNQEVAKLNAGDAVTLSVVSGGRQREVKLNAVKASELSDGDGFSFFFNGDGAFTLPRMEFPNFQVMPKLDLKGFQNLPRGTTYYYNDGGKIRADIEEQVQRALKDARIDRQDIREKIDRAMEESRKAGKGGTYYRGSDEMSDEIREKVEKAMERARDAMEKAHKEMDKPLVKRSVIKAS